MPKAARLPVAILAGGLATRLRPLTDSVPKALLPVAGKPFLEHQLQMLREEGVTHVVVCAGFLGEKLEAQFGNGCDHGLHIRYSFDGQMPLGTGGAVKHAVPLLGSSFFVMYGDSYLKVRLAEVEAAFVRSKKKALMTVYRNHDQWDKSNVWFEAGEVARYDKNVRQPEMQHIDYGLMIFSSDVFEPYPGWRSFDLATVLMDLVAQNELAGFEVQERFYEIGSHSGLHELDRLLSEGNVERKGFTR